MNSVAGDKGDFDFLRVVIVAVRDECTPQSSREAHSPDELTGGNQDTKRLVDRMTRARRSRDEVTQMRGSEEVWNQAVENRRRRRKEEGACVGRSAGYK